MFYFHAGLEPAVFAALVPNSADKPLQELIEEVMGDHEMLVSWFYVLTFTCTVAWLIPYHQPYIWIYTQTGQQSSWVLADAD